MIGCRPTPNAEYGEFTKEAKTEEFSIEVPIKYHPALEKRAIFKDTNTKNDLRYLHGLYTTEFPQITSPR